MRKTILFFGHTAKLGGGEIALLNLVQQLDRSTYEPVVLLASDGPLRDRLEAAEVESHVLPLAAGVIETRKDSLGSGSLLRLSAVWHSLTYVFRLATWLKKRGVDLVHTNTLKADLLGGIGARLARVPVVWHVRDRIADDYLPHRVVRVFQWLCRWLPNFVIANSQATMDTLRLAPNERGRAEQAVVHDGFPGDCRRCVAPASGAPTIGLVGRITEWKGQHIFIEAASRVRSRFPQARFQIIGSAMFGEEVYEARLRAMVVDHELENCVAFMGFRTDVQDLIGQLTILVHSSTTGEPFGQVVIEGMAAGKPVIATRGGGVPEIVVDGTTGLLVKMSDAEEMAKAMIELLTDPARARAMGAAGQKRVADHFTIRETARKVEAVYRRIFRQKTGRRALQESGADPTNADEAEVAPKAAVNN